MPLIVVIGLNYPQNPMLGSIWMVTGTILLSPIFQYLRVKGESILLPSIFHGIFNRTAVLSLIFFGDLNRFIVGATGISWIYCIWNY